MREHSEVEMAAWKTWADNKVQVQKQTRKPFKSGSKANTATGLGLHPTTNQWTFTFAEDDSEVECFRCKLALSPGAGVS